MSGQQELICGLSRVVTIAVLPRLNMEELIFELNRRIQNLDKENSIKDRLVSILREVMLEEYHHLERKSGVSSLDERAIPEQEQEAVTMQEDVPTLYTDTMPSTPDTPTFSRQWLDTNNSMSPSCTDNTWKGATPCEETPLDSFQPTPDHSDVHIKMECHVFEDDQIEQISQPSNPHYLQHHTDDRETSIVNNGHEQCGSMNSVETSFAPCQPTPYQACENTTSLVPDKTSQADSVSKHRQRHTGDKHFICGKCGYRAYHKHQLVKHMGIHTSEKPFKCNQCKYKTSFREGLVEHMKRHKDTEPYSCGVCDYQTYVMTDIVKHMKSHDGAKPHRCEECDYRTIYKSDLTRHRRLHTGERPYSCQECDYKAREKGNLLKHMRNKHY